MASTYTGNVGVYVCKQLIGRTYPAKGTRTPRTPDRYALAAFKFILTLPEDQQAEPIKILLEDIIIDPKVAGLIEDVVSGAYQTVPNEIRYSSFTKLVQFLFPRPATPDFWSWARLRHTLTNTPTRDSIRKPCPKEIYEALYGELHEGEHVDWTMIDFD